MAMGTRDPEQPPLWIAASDLPVSPGHPFYTRLNALLDADGHCQLVDGSALLPRDIEAPDRSQQAHVTASHSTNARVRSRRW